MLDEIILEAVQTKAGTKGTVLDLTWKTTYEEAPYRGTYTVELREGQQEPQKWTGIAFESWHFETDTPLSDQKTYTIRIGGTESGRTVFSDAETLLLHTVSEVFGRYDGQTLYIKWRDEPSDIAYVVVSAEDGSVAQSERGIAQLEMPIRSIRLDEKKPCKVTVRPHRSDASTGPDCPISFYPAEARVASVEGTEQKPDGLELLLKLAHPVAEKSGLRAGLSVRFDEVELCRSFAGCPADGAAWRFSLPKDVIPDSLRLGAYSAHVALCSSQISGIFSSSGVPLGAVWPVSVTNDAKTALLEWEWKGEGRPAFYEVEDGGTVKVVYESQAKTDFASQYTKSLAVRPVFGAAKGMARSVNKLFRPGFYARAGSGDYEVGIGSTSPYGDQSVTLAIPEPLFSTPPSGAISAQGITLTPPADGKPYLLTWEKVASVKSGGEETNFLELLEAGGILPRGLFLILEVLGRVKTCGYRGLLKEALNLEIEKRCIDLRPGMALRIEAEQYKPSMSAAASDGSEVLLEQKGGAFLPGFVLSGTAQYELSGNGGGLLWKTEFDPFLSQFYPGILSRESRDSLEHQNGGGGLIDLYEDTFRHPFFRMRYPEGFFGSQSPGTDYAPANACLFGADQYTSLRELGGTKGDSLAKFYFRGRTTITPLLHVMVNGRDTCVPVGTSLGNLLNRFGRQLPQPEEFRLERSLGPGRLWSDAGMGRETFLPVHFEPGALDGAAWSELPLLGGDRLWL